MMNFPPFGPLMTAGAPLTTTIVVVGAPFVVAVALAFGVVAGVLCIARLRARRGRRQVGAFARVRVPQVAMLYTAAGEAR